MLVAAQFPLCDLRPLMASPTGRLRLPPPALCRPGQSFVRGFGPLVRRRRGGEEDWAGEEIFYEAHRALRLPHPFSPGPPPGEMRRLAGRCAFRRLFGFTTPVPRVEVGLSLHFIDPPGQGIHPAHAAALLRWVASLPVEVPGNDRPAFGGPLLGAGAPLARRLLVATSRGGSTTRAHERWVEPGEPVFFVEHRADELRSLPEGLRRIPALSRRYAIELAHGRFTGHGCSFRAWFLEIGPKTQRDALRRLRLHLLRLHAEREGLKTVLRAVATGGIEVQPGSEGTERLERYLQDTLRLVARPRRYGLEQSTLFPLARAYEDLIEPGLVASLHQHLEHTRDSVRRKVRRAAQASHPTRDPLVVLHSGELTMNQFNIKLGDHNVLHGDFVVAQRIQDSFNQLAKADIPDELKQRLEELSKAVADMTTHLDEARAREAARDLDTLTCEATSPEPRKAWYELAAESLVRTAGTVGDAAGSVVKLVRTVLILLGN